MGHTYSLEELGRLAPVWADVEWTPTSGPLPADWEPYRVAVAPFAWTPARKASFFAPGTKTTEEFTAWWESTVAKVLIDWTIYATPADREAGTPLPITPATWNLFPEALGAAIWRALTQVVATDFRTPGTPSGTGKPLGASGPNSTSRRSRRRPTRTPTP